MKINLEIDTTEKLQSVDLKILQALDGLAIEDNGLKFIFTTTPIEPLTKEVEDAVPEPTPEEIFKEPIGELPEEALTPEKAFSEPVGKLPESAVTVEATAVTNVATQESTISPTNVPWDENLLDQNGWPHDPRVNNAAKTMMASNNPQKGVKKGDFKLTKGKTKEELAAVREEHSAAGFPRTSTVPAAPTVPPQTQGAAAAEPDQVILTPEQPTIATEQVEAVTLKPIDVLQRIGQTSMVTDPNAVPQGVADLVCQMVGINNLQEISLKENAHVLAPYLNTWNKVVEWCQQNPALKVTLIAQWESYKCQFMPY